MMNHSDATSVAFPARRVALVGLRRPDEHPWAVDAAFDAVERWLRVGGRRVVYRVWQRRWAPDPATYIGRGKALQLRGLCERDGIDGIVVDGALSGSQREGLERLLARPVWDRTAWGAPRTPSAALTRAREAARAARRSRNAFVVVLCGAVGAGKSTLFAALTNGPPSPPSWPPEPAGRGALAVAGRLNAAWSREVVVVDTPGLVRHPVSARWSAPEDTLAECRAADLMLHVIDASHPEARRRAREAAETVAAMGACPVTPVWTQVDRVAGAEPFIAEWLVSGRTGTGCGRLREYLRGSRRGRVEAPQVTRESPGCSPPREGASRRWRDQEPFDTGHMARP
ncbi:MAG: GTPase [Nitrospirota bacterium]